MLQLKAIIETLTFVIDFVLTRESPILLTGFLDRTAHNQQMVIITINYNVMNIKFSRNNSRITYKSNKGEHTTHKK